MSHTYGRQTTITTGIPLQVTADGEPIWKIGGITLDWTTVPVASGDQTLLDGTVVKNGQAGIQFGQILCLITASGKYGPYNSAAADGRQLLNRGDCFILNSSVLQLLPATLGGMATDNPPVFDGGRVWFARLGIVGGAAVTYFGATYQPTRAAFEAAFPAITYLHTAS